MTGANGDNICRKGSTIQEVSDHPEGFRWEVLNKAKLPPGWSCTSRMVTTNASQNYQRQIIN